MGICITIIILFIFMRSPLIIFFTHPILLAYLLVVYAVLISFFLALIRIRWFLYLLVLIFYITTMSANEKLYHTSQVNSRELIIYGVFVLGFYSFIFPIKKTRVRERALNFTLTLMETSSRGIYVWITFYLLLVIIRVVKIVKLEEGPLVKRL